MSATTTQFQVTGMTCGHCEMSVREEVSEVPGVQGVEVSHETGLLTPATQGADDAAGAPRSTPVTGGARSMRAGLRVALHGRCW